MWNRLKKIKGAQELMIELKKAGFDFDKNNPVVINDRRD
jgi:hypothetical protein